MNALINAAPTMSSREIADLVELRHDNVKRTIAMLSGKGLVSFTQSEETSHQGAGARPVSVYLVNQRDSYVIVAQLSPEFTAKLVDRWQELEAGVAAIRVPQTFKEALMLAVEQQEQIEKLQLTNTKQAAVIDSEVNHMTVQKFLANHDIYPTMSQAITLGKRATKLSDFMGLPIEKRYAIKQDDGRETVRNEYCTRCLEIVFAEMIEQGKFRVG